MSSGTLAPAAVEAMFDRISPVYDPMNRLMTAGLDRRWRRLAVRAVVRPGDRVLDACCGTGDLALEAERAGGRVTGLDFSERMLERARRKSAAVEWVRGDLLALPFADASFDAATVGFGIRNVADLDGGLRELARVLRPGGRLVLTMPVESRTPAHAHTLRGAGDLGALLRGAGLRVCRLEPRWHLGFGDDRRHVFALAEAPRGGDYVPPDALRNPAGAFPEPEAV